MSHEVSSHQSFIILYEFGIRLVESRDFVGGMMLLVGEGGGGGWGSTRKKFGYKCYLLTNISGNSEENLI